MRQRYFDVPFALSGDQTAIPDPLQGGGTVSFTEGWNFNYQRDLTTDPAALPIDRSTMNWLFYQITLALAAIQAGGIPEWITAAQNGGVALPYGKGSEVLYSVSGNPPFTKYVSLIDNNTDTPGATANWQVVVDGIATASQANAGTDNTTIMTPLRVASQTALRALLAGSATQVFNAAKAAAASNVVRWDQNADVVSEVRNFQAAIGASSATITMTFDEAVVKTALGGLSALSGFQSLTFNGVTNGANGMDVGPLPTAVSNTQSGFVAIYLIYNPTSNTFATLGWNTTSFATPEVYTGANMPSGYTMSCLLTILPTNVNALIQQVIARNRNVGFVGQTIFSAATISASPTIINNLVVPISAKTFDGFLQIGNSAGAGMGLNLHASTVAMASKVLAATLAAGTSIAVPFAKHPIATSQRTYYSSNSTAGTPTFVVNVNGYDF